MKNDPSLDPSTTSSAYDYMCPLWFRINSVLGGLDTMRAAGQNLLPKHERETTEGYTERLNKARMVNHTEITLESLVGRPFSDPLQLNSDHAQSPILEPLMEDLDLLGNDLHTVAREWFHTGVAKGIAHVLVEFPTRNDDLDRPRTLRDDKDEGLRPYFVLIPPENLIFAHAETINGHEQVTHVRIREVVKERVGFMEVDVETIREINPGQVTIWEKVDPDKHNSEWKVRQQFDYDLPFIPLVTFYANREEFMEAKPPLLDLADLNIAHWQSNSDQTNVLTVARFPLLAGSGVDVDDAVVVGPRKFLRTGNAQAKFYYVEHEGHAIAAGQVDLDTLEKQMTGYGAQFLIKRPGRETATARALDSAESSTPLGDMTLRFMSALEQALGYMLVWLGQKPDMKGLVVLPTDFGPETVAEQDLKTLSEARLGRDISQETYWAELARRGVLGNDFDPKEEKTRLENEAGTFGDTDEDLDPEGDDA